MSVSEMFSEFVGNLSISNIETISNRYGELTAALNRCFRDTESKTANTLQVGSFGRKTGINGISDLDMLYIMPKNKWDTYKSFGQRRLLQDTRDAILKRYPKTQIKVDRLVVTVTYTNFHVEVQPVFEQEDLSYLYPDTKNGGSWKTTKPREEMNAVSVMDSDKNRNLRRLCKMARAWRNKHGVAMGGLLIDTLVYNYLTQTEYYDSKSYLYYDWLSRDFFKYLSELPKQNEYAAPGSRQRVRVKKSFQGKAKQAYDLCLKAIEAENKEKVNEKWKRVYGRPFPVPVTIKEQVTDQSYISWDNTEEFIEDRFPVDIKGSINIDCEVSQNGFRDFLLRHMLSRRIPLRAKKTLYFKVIENTIDEPYQIYWKVLNRGEVARKRNCIRGRIEKDKGQGKKKETTDFRGKHVVECYCVKDGVVVARDSILVPIVTGGTYDE